MTPAPLNRIGTLCPFTCAVCFVALAALFARSDALWAQDAPSSSSPARLSGRISGPSGEPIEAAQVYLLEAKRVTLSDADGRYRFAQIPGGVYSVSVSRIGYKPVVKSVRVSDAGASLDVTMIESLVEVAPVQVTATPFATDILSSPQPVAVLGGTDLRVSQSPSLGETIASVPGLRSWGTGTGIGKPVIRGLSSQRVLVLQDGVRLDSQGWGDEHSPNVETAGADRIEVIKGPASVLYGSDALGGVINVIHHRLPSAIDAVPFVRGRLTTGFRSNTDQPDGLLAVEGARGSLGFRASLSGRTSDDISTPSGRLRNSGNDAGAGSGEIGYRDSWGSVSVGYTRREERVEIHEDPDEEPDFTGYQRLGTNVGTVRADIPTSQGRLELEGGFTRNKRREFEDEDATEVALGLLSTDWIGTMRLHHSLSASTKGVVGLSAARHTFEKFGEESLIPESQDRNLGIFAFEQIDLGRIGLSAGLRFDDRTLDVDADDVLGVTSQTREFESVAGNLGAIFHIAENAALVGNVGRGFRSPSSFELFAYGVHEGTVAFERGDPDLKNEESINFDLALRAQSNRLVAELNGFENLVDDFIYSQPTGEIDDESGFRIFDVRQGDARIDGLEGSVDFHATELVHLTGEADYVRARNTTLDEPLPFIPPVRISGAVRLEAQDRGSIRSPYFLFGVDRTLDQTEPNPIEQDEDVAALENTGYTLARIGAGCSFGFGARTLSVDLNVKNLFDEVYVDWMSRYRHYAFAPGRDLTVQATLEY